MLKSKLGFVAPSVAVRCARAHGVDWTSHAQRVSPLVPSVVLFLDAARVGLQVGHSTVHEEGEGAEEFPQFADRPLAVRGRAVCVWWRSHTCWWGSLARRTIVSILCLLLFVMCCYCHCDI